MFLRRLGRLAAILSLLAALGGGFAHADATTDFGNATMIAMAGGKMTEAEAAKLEESLVASPDNVRGRVELLGYYFMARVGGKSSAGAAPHILWLIEHQPASPILATPFGSIHQATDSLLSDNGNPSVAAARELWKKQIALNPPDPAIWGNIASFFQQIGEDERIAIAALKTAIELAPDDSHWSDQLAQLYSRKVQFSELASEEARQIVAAESLQFHEAALAKKTTEIDRFYALADVAQAALDAGDQTKAEMYAGELVRLAPAHADDWNYGNAVHHGHRILGHVALAKGDVEAARAELLASGKTTGSPQLDSFGPSFSLARAMLAKGEREAVATYLRDCKVFWEMRPDDYDNWIILVENGGTPDFDRR